MQCPVMSAICIAQNSLLWVHRYLEAFDRLAGDASKRESLSASNAAEAATTLAAVADMLLKMGQVDEAADSLATSLDLLEQHPGQLPALQVCHVPMLGQHTRQTGQTRCLATAVDLRMPRQRPNLAAVSGSSYGTSKVWRASMQ